MTATEFVRLCVLGAVLLFAVAMAHPRRGP